MSKEFGGDQARRAAELAAFDPHYMMPADVKGDLDTLFEALDTVGLLAGAVDPAHDVGVGNLSALNHSLSTLGKRLMGDLQASYPTIRGAAEA
ncbi:hypothetical protein [Novosphingobium sp. KACC 22771]|uniref:hypothetical protein n=1 Tax=Novosphingobium sp. KACC 22771 TaxID=3025670 RepID=UPI002366D078|nr:hypothetical protein [Novosphingobium sp. KACC 22771]WDF71502.1 hypothetical protein PQ467_11865 [Novosphingobium sp. KACC 22771]